MHICHGILFVQPVVLRGIIQYTTRPVYVNVVSLPQYRKAANKNADEIPPMC